MLKNFYWSSAVLLFAVIPGWTADVTIIAVDPFGHMLKGCSVEQFISQDAGHQNFASKFSGLRSAEDLPFGQYKVTLSCPGLIVNLNGPISLGPAGTVSVGGENEHSAAVLSKLLGVADFGPSGVPEAVVKVDHLAQSDTRTRWIKLVALYSDDILVMALSAENKATLVHPHRGKYWLALFDEGDLVCQGTVELPGELRDAVSIDVAAGCVIAVCTVQKVPETSGKLQGAN
jgi:hypothetical protein